MINIDIVNIHGEIIWENIWEKLWDQTMCNMVYNDYLIEDIILTDVRGPVENSIFIDLLQISFKEYEY